MALLRYLKPIDRLSDPKDSLSYCIQVQAIAQTNVEVRKPMKSMSRKCELYQVYNVDISTKIDKYASHYSVTTASHFLQSWTSLLVRVQYNQFIKHIWKK